MIPSLVRKGVKTGENQKNSRFLENLHLLNGKSYGTVVKHIMSADSGRVWEKYRHFCVPGHCPANPEKPKWPISRKVFFSHKSAKWGLILILLLEVILDPNTDVSEERLDF